MGDCSVLGANSMSQAARICLGILNTMTSLTATCGNLLVILVILYYKSLRRRSNYLILCLAITDLTVGLLLQPLASAQIFNAIIGSNCNLAYAVTYIGAMLCGASSWTLALISYDRYLHLVKLTNYNLFMTNKKLWLMVAFSWLFPISFGLLLFSDVTMDAYYGILVLSANVVIVIIMVCYKRSWSFIRDKAKVFPRQTDMESSKQEKDRITHHWKVAKTFALIISCFLLCWTPMVSFVVYLMIIRKTSLSVGSFTPYLHTVYYLTLLMGYSNSTINPCIYFWRNRELKAAMKQFVLNVILRQKRVQEAGLPSSVTQCSTAQLDAIQPAAMQPSKKLLSST